MRISVVGRSAAVFLFESSGEIIGVGIAHLIGYLGYGQPGICNKVHSPLQTDCLHKFGSTQIDEFFEPQV